MESNLISGIQLGSAIESDYTISDDIDGPSPSDPSRFKIWGEAKIVLNSGKHYTQEIVGKSKSMLPIFNIAFNPMPHMGYDDKSFEEVSFLSEISEISIESGDLFEF